MDRIECTVRLIEHQQRLADAAKVHRHSRSPRSKVMDTARVVRSIKRGIVALSVFALLVLSMDTRAVTFFDVTHEGWTTGAVTNQPRTYADMQFHDWNTQLPGDVGGKTVHTPSLTSADLRFREENTWLPTGK